MKRQSLKTIVQQILKWQAKAYIRVKGPIVIIVAGTNSRYWIKEKVLEGLKEKGCDARANRKNFNAEIGLPLSILGLESGEGDFYKWRKTLIQGFKRIFQGVSREYLVLEAAIDRPDDMKYLLGITKPQVVILTTITMIYQENFDDLDSIAQEYRTLVAAIPTGGKLILNRDDERIVKLSRYFQGVVITYGFHQEADFKATEVKKEIDGQLFLLNSKNKRFTKKIPQFGKHHVYAELVKEIVQEII